MPQREAKALPSTAQVVHTVVRMMRKILVAVDGSEASLHALKKAFEFSDAMGAEVTLSHVVPHVFVPAEVPFDAGLLAKESLKAGETLLNDMAAQVGRPGMPRLCLTGSPAEAIADCADNGPFELVVVGSKGRGAVSRVLVGSTTDRLVHISRKPVLVVR
jgi:nucleotide-binding universal stress UspA family protein